MVIFAVRSVPETVKLSSVEGAPWHVVNALEDIAETVTIGAVTFDSKLPISVKLILDTPLWSTDGIVTALLATSEPVF